MPDGKSRLHEIMARLQGALNHVRGLSMIEMSPKWRGEAAPVGRLGFWTYIAMAAAIAAAVMLLIYIILRLILMSAGEAPAGKVDSINPGERLRLSREGAAMPPPAAGAQANKLKTFLAGEIANHEVAVIDDGATVRVRTTVGQLFQSASDALEPGRADFFARIGKAIQEQPGKVTVEGHADSDQIHSLAFPDNMALSQARADKVADIIKAQLTDPTRVTSKGWATRRRSRRTTAPPASRRTAASKSSCRVSIEG